MKLWKRIAQFALVVLISYAAYTLISTGFFRSVENVFDGEVHQRVLLKGAEDITLSRKDSFGIISATNRAVYPPKETERGGLYLLDLKNEAFGVKQLTANLPTAFAPHGISIFKKDSTYQVMAISHNLDDHSIFSFELKDDKLSFEKVWEDPTLVSPNDLVLVGENQFYFTNDHGYTKGLGKVLEEYGGLSVSNVVYFDGEKFREVADGISYANGIIYDDERQLLYVASARKFEIKVYSRMEDGSLEFIENIACSTGVDNIELDENGDIWLAGHPNLLRFKAYAKGKKETAPSEILKVTYRGRNDYSVEHYFSDDGKKMSGSSVATPFGDYVFAGNVMDEHFLILKKK